MSRTSSTSDRSEGREWRKPLGEFLREAVFPKSSAVEVLSLDAPGGGASWETFFITVAVSGVEGAQEHRLVLKRAPRAGPMAPYEISKDVAILESLARSDIPVPALLGYTEDPAVFRRPFTVVGFVEGESPDLSKVERWPLWQEMREELGNAIVDVAAAMSTFRWGSTSLASVMGPAGGARARLAFTIDRYLLPLLERSEEERVPQPAARDIAVWLKDNAHEIREEELALVHGDFRFGNFIFRETDIVAVIDWERSMLGDPMSNLGFFCMPMSRRDRPELMGKTLTFGQLRDRYEGHHGLEFSPERILFYCVFWQFLEYVNSSRNVLESVRGDARSINFRGLVAPNLLLRQTFQLMDDYEGGRFDSF